MELYICVASLNSFHITPLFNYLSWKSFATFLRAFLQDYVDTVNTKVRVMPSAKRERSLGMKGIQGPKY